MRRFERFLTNNEGVMLQPGRFEPGYGSPTCFYAEGNFEKLFQTPGRAVRRPEGIDVVTDNEILIARFEPQATVTNFDLWEAGPSEATTLVVVKNPNDNRLQVTRQKNYGGLGLGIRNGLAVHIDESLGTVLFMAKQIPTGWEVTRPVAPSYQKPLREGLLNWAPVIAA